MVLDFSVSLQSAHSIPDDWFWLGHVKTSAQKYKCNLWIPYFHVDEKYRYLEVCSCVLWAAVVESRLAHAGFLYDHSASVS